MSIVPWEAGSPGEPPRVLIAGIFAQAGNQWVQNAAVWNGSRWEALGEGPEIRVASAAVFRGQAVVGGEWPGVSMRVWDGASWRLPVGGSPTGRVTRFLEYRGRLAVLGSFQGIGSLTTQNIALWDGEQWFPMDGGVGGVIGGAEEIDGELVVGGWIYVAGGMAVDSIAAWDGSRWRRFGDRVGSRYLSLAKHNERLVALIQDGTARSIQRWTGTTWEPVPGVLPANVTAIASAAGSLFAIAGPVLWRWEESAWGEYTRIDSGIISTLREYGDGLLIGGRFRSAGGVELGSIGFFDGRSWTPLGGGTERNAAALGHWRGELVVASNVELAPSGGVSRQKVESWDGYRWRRLGAIGDRPDGIGYATSFVERDGSLVMGGSFSVVDGVLASNIARFDGSVWVPMGEGLDGSVRTLALYGGNPVAGGYFGASGANRVWRLARWTGSQWVQLGSDLSQDSYGIWDLLPMGGDLVVAGDFNRYRVGALPAGAARWDGSAWHTMGAVWPGVTSLTRFNGRVVASREVFYPKHSPEWWILEWTGSDWAPLGPPSMTAGRMVHVHEGMLLRDGALAVWDGTAWQSSIPYGFGQIGPMTSWNGHLAAVGVVGYYVNALRLWASSLPAPRITVQPGSAVACVGSGAELSAGFEGVAPFELRWVRDGQPVALSARVRAVLAPDGRSSSLIFDPVHAPDRGRYALEVVTPCGTVRSSEADLVVCVPDWDCDGAVTPMDFAAFVADLVERRPWSDLDGDGETDFNDLLAYLNAFNAGCP